METYRQAQARLLQELAALGWTVKPGLKVPQAISPDKALHLYFKPQAVYDDTGHSLWVDIRGMPVEAFVAHARR